VWTAVHAVHAQDALTYPDILGRLTSSLTISVTEMALAAFGATLSCTYSPERKCAQDAKKGSQRAEESAIEAGDPEVQQKGGEKDGSNKPRTEIVALAG
jgi:hypothetical protein